MFDYPDYIYKSYSSLEDYIIYREMCDAIRYSLLTLNKKQITLLDEVVLKNNDHLIIDPFDTYLMETLKELLDKYQNYNWQKNQNNLYQIYV